MENCEEDLSVLFEHACPFSSDGQHCLSELIEYQSDDLRALMFSIQEMEKKERELFIKGYFLCASSIPRKYSTAFSPSKKRPRPTHDVENENNNNSSKEKQMAVYCLHNHRICKEAFVAIFDLKEKQHRWWLKQTREHEFSQMHGNTKRIPHNTISLEQNQEVVSFLERIATIHSLPDPTEKALILLPSQMTNSFLYTEYKQHKEFKNENV
eukprot:GCRY01004153.1.p1 GENE.GCRY01004153.1~~GCRY01004153.1.p1  ORF type:complete len:211 (-),score=18.98 GCRY01004153.1:1379-2011(-)